MIETISSEQKLLAIIVPHDYAATGVNFITPHNLSQQLAYIQHPTGKMIEPHRHNRIAREVYYTQEVLVLKRGRLKVDFYDDDQRYVQSRILQAGDVILLAGGGHGFEVLEEIEMIEVKQGPYAGEGDKTRFVQAEAGNER
jgi:mannose-6-phosphate isomerase-like protein (cupin superfamily)